MIQLGKALEIARINLLRQVRNRRSLFFLIVLPTIIIVALGIQFGGVSRPRLGIVAPPGDAAGAMLVTVIGENPADFEIREIADEATLRSQVERGMLEAGIVVPDGFAASLQGSGTATVTYLGTTDALTLGLRAPVEAAIARVAAIATATRVAVAEGAGSWADVSAVAEAGYDAVPGITVDVRQVGDEGLFAGFSQFTFGATTQLVMFMFLTSMTAAAGLVLTKQLGVSRRMVSTPTSAWTIVVGEAAGRIAVVLLQGGYIVLMTAVVFHVSWGDPLAAGMLILVFGIVAAAAALLVGALSRNPDQASSLGVFAGLALGALGGCMVPYQTMPAAMQQVARLIPHSWALLGLQSLIRDGGGIASVATNLAVLLGFGVVLMALAAWRFRKAIAG
ncbi:MAG TPA: ABC transporter permease [Candidatus Limnocylindrales bacterium]|nr:ABC transporter permease [Candidatus Limnocylindrales bacterium]